jgi:hypothetical protein
MTMSSFTLALLGGKLIDRLTVAIWVEVSQIESFMANSPPVVSIWLRGAARVL